MALPVVGHGVRVPVVGCAGVPIKTDRKGRTKRGKDCRRCKATGKRIRVGRHLYNVAARLHRDGTR
ncbi:hypothetical protein ACFVXE_36440 [Streptomyces sp. NPDC058231]|uniref:hypothetical protein n=1 Tax=Streptomyces sp. NPDC058231 TaxID=3346392 RepID=UPI0036E5D28E